MIKVFFYSKCRDEETEIRRCPVNYMEEQALKCCIQISQQLLPTVRGLIIKHQMVFPAAIFFTMFPPILSNPSGAPANIKTHAIKQHAHSPVVNMVQASQRASVHVVHLMVCSFTAI